MIFLFTYIILFGTVEAYSLKVLNTVLYLKMYIFEILIWIMVHFMTSLRVGCTIHSPCSITLKEQHYFVPLFNVCYLELLGGGGQVGLN